MDSMISYGPRFSPATIAEDDRRNQGWVSRVVDWERRNFEMFLIGFLRSLLREDPKIRIQPHSLRFFRQAKFDRGLGALGHDRQTPDPIAGEFGDERQRHDPVLRHVLLQKSAFQEVSTVARFDVVIQVIARNANLIYPLLEKPIQILDSVP